MGQREREAGRGERAKKEKEDGEESRGGKYPKNRKKRPRDDASARLHQPDHHSLHPLSSRSKSVSGTGFPFGPRRMHLTSISGKMGVREKKIMGLVATRSCRQRLSRGYDDIPRIARVKGGERRTLMDKAVEVGSHGIRKGTGGAANQRVQFRVGGWVAVRMNNERGEDLLG